MSRLSLVLALLAFTLAACGGGSPPTPLPTGPGAPTPGPTVTQPAGGSSPAPNAGDAEAIARALVPPGATEVSTAKAGDFFSLSLTSDQSVAELETFWDQKLPTTGVTVTGKFTAAGTLTMAFTDPDGGITAAPSDSGGTVIVISVGTQ